MSGLNKTNLPSLKKFWKQSFFLLALAIGTAYSVKSNVTIRRKQQYIKERSSYDPTQQKPIDPETGLPIENDKYKRKSEYEGAGSSYMSRVKGDKFNWWSR
ncbi:hypothetical protein B5S28_g2329 [[Candida] boidinii]|nr:hypothetical protein B5S28_g2329 [[Candida] boidinii]OWB59600.1 hypothetical protein B5S29_g460 [[Candida] boidinii]OWB70491.1 hypothetical protein B5S31_g169 [[Candida] boidinii]OWB80732.1 hypothetical protein B5S32_g5029 [[Candida] boidinii]